MCSLTYTKNAFATDYVFECSGCSSVQMLLKAKSKRPKARPHYALVVNADENTIKYYKVSRVIKDDFIEHIEAIELNVPSDLEIAFYDYSLVYQEVRDRLVSQQSSFDFIASQRSESIYSPALNTSSEQDQVCNVGEFYPSISIITPTSAFEVKSANQALQNVMFELYNRADVSAAELGLVNDFAASVARFLDVSSFFPVIPVRLKFNDNSSVLVQYGFISGKVEFVPKESFDGNCNLIPDKNSEISREYRFKTIEQFYSMESWLRYYNVHWSNQPGEICRVILVDCVPTENKHTCIWRKTC